MADIPYWKEPELSPARRLKNWWHYNWKLALLCAAVLAFAGRLVFDHAVKTEPDCTVALVTRRAADSAELESIRAALESVCPDANGDGTVFVEINAIQIDYTSTDLSPEALRVMEANLDKLNFDFYTRQSGIFLLQDPELFERNHRALAYLDGSVPAEGAADWENMARPWTDWPGSGGVELVSCRADSLWFARRIVSGEKDEQAFAGAKALWDALF